MDPLTHLLLTRKMIGADQKIVAAGLAADLPFYLTYPIWLIARGGITDAVRRNEWPEAPQWMQRLHHIFHSLPVLLAVIIVIRLVKGDWPLWGAAWGLHILVDIPTHSRQTWAPQFLWPFSDVTVDGVSWPEVTISIFQRLFKGLYNLKVFFNEY